LHQDILHRWLDKRQYSIYTEKGKRANEQPLLPQSHFSAVDCFYRDFFAEPKLNDIIFWLHMPLFFLISGYLFKTPERKNIKIWCIKQVK